MLNVIELENDLNYEVDDDVLLNQGIIKLSTDLHPDDQSEALDDILFVKGINTNKNDEVVPLFMNAMSKIGVNFGMIRQYFYDYELVPKDILTNNQQTPEEILDHGLIDACFRYFGGYHAIYKALGYKIVKNYEDYSIVNKNIDDSLLDDYRNGYRFYVITLYRDDQKVESIHNVHIQTETELIAYVKHQFDLSNDFALVYNPLSARNFDNIPKVKKTIKSYHFEPIE